MLMDGTKVFLIVEKWKFNINVLEAYGYLKKHWNNIIRLQSLYTCECRLHDGSWKAWML